MGFSEQEIEWRMALEKDSLVDAMKRDLKCKAQMWAKGKVASVLGDNLSDLSSRKLVIKFDNDNVLDHTYPATSCYIAKYNTRSNEQDWRDELQKGDKVDVCDKNGTWSTGTVV